MANVFVSMPCVGGNIHQKTVITLDHITRKHSLNLHYIENCSLVTKARQDHFGMFLKSKDDYLLSVDADLVLGPPEILDDMVERCPENAVIGGLYAMKALTMEGKCVFNGTQYDKSKKIELNGDLLRMKYIPNGFLLMPRKIALLLTEKYQDLKYIDNQIGETYAVYNTMLIADEGGVRRFLPEDFSLCERLTNIGVEIYADTKCMLGHIGQYLYHLEEFRKNGS